MVVDRQVKTYRQCKVLLCGAFSAYTLDSKVSGTVISLRLFLRKISADNRFLVSTLDFSSVRKSKHKRSKVLQYIHLLIKYFQQSRRADIIFLNFSPYGLSTIAPFALLNKLFSRKPLIIRLFGGKSPNTLPFILRFFTAILARHANIFYFQTHLLVNEFRKYRAAKHLPNTRIMRDQNQANPHYFPVIPTFVFIGHLKIAKGILVFIDAARDNPHYLFHVYGPNYDNIDFSKVCKDIPNLSYFGSVTHDRVDNILTSCTALILPSTMDGEGYPGVLLEAMNAGCPIIASSWPPVLELLVNTQACIVNPEVAFEINMAIKTLAEDPDLQKAMSKDLFVSRRNYDFNVIYASITNELLSCF
jgi:glycosyltransferase involved in cell wall biosynthesis